MIDKTRVKPVHMAICTPCLEKIRAEYGERAEDHPGTWHGRCGLCWEEKTVCGVDLWPKVRRTYRQQTGGGERRRAGRQSA